MIRNRRFPPTSVSPWRTDQQLPALPPRCGDRRGTRRGRVMGPRSGLSLLEAILAIAILGGAIAAVGESIRLGSQAAADARDFSMAQLLCEAKLTELASGLQPLMPVMQAPLEVAPDWMYTVEIESVDQQALLAIFVTVERDPAQSARPLSITLTRWLIDPDMLLQLRSTEIEMEMMRNSGAAGSVGGGLGNG